MKRGTSGDHAVIGFPVFGVSMPDFFFGILLLFLFSMRLRLLPSAGSGTFAHLIMPVLTIGTPGIRQFSRFTRSAMLQTLASPYTRTAVAKGVPWNRILCRHALPNAAIPIVTPTGSVVVETVFGWPGIGRMLIRSVAFRDIPIVQGLVLVTAASIITAHLLVDIVYGFVDPRIRIGKAD